MGIELLDSEDREVVILRHWNSMTFQAIGERLNISEDAAWMRHSRAVSRLGRKVGELRRGNIEEILSDR
jgi:DNA-directed RNA polymerase specialized sigma24 family protein